MVVKSTNIYKETVMSLHTHASLSGVGSTNTLRAVMFRCAHLFCTTLVYLWFLSGISLNAGAQSAFRPTLNAKVAADLTQSLNAGTPAQRFAVVVVTDGSPIQAASVRTNLRTSAAISRAAWHSLGGSGAYAALLSSEQLTALAGNPHVLHISPDRKLQAFADYAPQAVGADLAWQTPGVTGKGITVAVLDTGVAPHADLSPNTRLIGWVDLVNGNAQPYDDNGHGTHVAGLVAGNGYTAAVQGYNISLKRTAPDTQIVGVKVLDATGAGNVSTVIAGINWAITNRARYNIRILNLSLGHPVAESYATDPLCQAVERAWKAGLVVVVAAGNMGRSVANDPTSAPNYGSIASPGNDPYVITVGAMNTCDTPSRADDVIASYSSRGPSAIDFVLKPDIVAPGNEIESLAAPGSTLAVQYPGNFVNPAEYNGKGPLAYFRLSGTSMATPIVAGAAAMLLQFNPQLSPDTIKARLMLSATKWTNSANHLDACTYGAGYLNIPAALSCPVVALSPALSPKIAPAANSSCAVDYTAWSNEVWSTNITWGGNKAAVQSIWGADTWTASGVWNSGFWGGVASSGGLNAASAEAILLNGD
jgi:serine protease AprX